MTLRRGEIVLATCALAMGGFIAWQAAIRPRVPRRATPVVTDDDSLFKVPVQLTAAERMRVAAERATTVRARIGESGSLTYIAEVLQLNDSTVRHWTARAGRPVTIWLQDPVGLVDYRATFGPLVTRALDQWSGVDGMPIRFQVVPDSAAAQVVVVWTTRLVENRIGLTRVEAVNDTIRSGRITIATQRDGNVALRDEDIARCALHEVGHLLGLTHTADALSIMAPESAQPALGIRDRATVSLLYALPIGSTKAGALR